MPREAEPSPPAWVRVIDKRRTREDPGDNSVGQTMRQSMGHLTSFYHKRMISDASLRNLLINIGLQGKSRNQPNHVQVMAHLATLGFSGG